MIFAEGSHDVGSRRVWQSQPPPGRAPRRRHHAASPSRRSPRSRSNGSRTRCPPTTGTRSSPSWCRSSSPTTAGCSATDDSTAPRSSRSSIRGSAASTRPRRGCARCARWRMPWWLRAAERLHLARLLRSLRYDTRYLPADRARVRRRRPAHARARGAPQALRLRPARASRATGSVLDRGRRRSTRCFAAANQALRPDSARPSASSSRASTRHAAAIEHLWHAPTQQYCSRDAVTHAAAAATDRRRLPPAARRHRPRGELRRSSCGPERPTGPRTRCRACPSAPATSRSTATGRAPPG